MNKRIFSIPFSPVFTGSKEFVCDDFTSSEFFFDSGLQLRDYQVYAKADDPVVRDKIQQYLIERDVSAFDSSVPDDEVEQSIVSKYDSGLNLLSRVKKAIFDARQVEKESAKAE